MKNNYYLQYNLLQVSLKVCYKLDKYLGFFPKLLTNLSFVNEQDKDKKKKEKDKKAAIQMILSNKELVVP